ncbi:hypothetical protein QN277_007765 [Acacia crassicarpa]|uniref:pectinesterase n=1 Tax=Acacia crassicarpa TaxID=499986 RepID=A0AAE1JVD6_9FABA|nr:hypothetical protein QN277_007765 [Acacia crassicarpa]
MQFVSRTFIFLIIFSCVCNANDCSNPSKVLTVGKIGRGKFRTIQRAINTIPIDNTRWIHIRIDAGNYTEKVIIPIDKPCVCLEGAGSSSTNVLWSDHDQTTESFTFESNAPNVIVKGIKFENSYNHPPGQDDDDKILPALAGAVRGDKTAIYDCVFKGVQDTLMDDTGRHYYHNCYIQGQTDFIFGKGQSIYQNCTIYFKSGDGRNGFIAAQKRESIKETSGYVFNGCVVDGIGQTMLGRAYGPYSRVIIANSYLSSVVDPVGWNAWHQSDVEKITFVEEENKGPGANKSKRVSWMKNMTKEELHKFLDLSYIDHEGWLNNRPSSLNS